MNREDFQNYLCIACGPGCGDESVTLDKSEMIECRSAHANPSMSARDSAIAARRSSSRS